MIAKHSSNTVLIKYYFYSQHVHYLSWLLYNVEAVKLILIFLKSKENLGIKGRLSHSATIIKLNKKAYYEVVGGQGPWCV